MAKVIRSRWIGDADAGLPRKDRQSCTYEAYVPDALNNREFAFDGRVAADIAEAEAALARLNAEASALGDTEALARLLLRAESVASSQIEGLQVGAGRLLRAEAARRLGESTRDVTAEEVLNNIDAMLLAVAGAEQAQAVTLDRLLEIHRRLLAGTRLAEHGGHLRSVQNWIGGSGFNPCSAAFVPPPPELVPELLDDLCAFSSDDSLPGVAQAAIAHAQFETIHPFVDGNGRTGRALIHVILRRRGLAPRVLAPVSLVLATWATDYIEALTAFRYVGSPTSQAARDGINRWVGLLSAACRRAVEDARAFEKRGRALEADWRGRLGRVRGGSAVDLLLHALPSAPLLTTKSASELIGRSGQAANQAIARLVEAGVLRQTNVGRRNRAFEAQEVVRAFTALERQLASPAGDTRMAPPVRAVPRGR